MSRNLSGKIFIMLVLLCGGSTVCLGMDFANPEDWKQVTDMPLPLLMLLIALGTLISEDLTSIGTGIMVAAGLIDYLPGIVACITGIVAGDVLLYLLGYAGRPIIGKAPLKWMVTQADLERYMTWFSRRGPIVIIISRFIPGTRFPVFIATGFFRLRLAKFFIFFLIASMIWTPVLVGLSVLLGGAMLSYFEHYKDYAVWLFIGIALVLMLLNKVIVPCLTYRGRRFLVSSWKRKSHWQYWRWLVLYPPTALYGFYLGIRSRCLGLFTAANPGITDGGFIGESKRQILNGFEGMDDRIARFQLLSISDDVSTRATELKAYMEEQDLQFPVIMKPNVGQRGAAVKLISSMAAAETYLKTAKWDCLVQEYIEGKEFALFYYRYPDQETGEILSLAEKEFPTLAGNGRHTVERLLLADPVAVQKAPFYLKRLGDRAFHVPEEGEQVSLVEVGSLARGVFFRDARELITPKLVKTIDTISKAHKGFCFGSYDIRTPSVEDLQQGRDFKIIELNGVISKVGHIYDPKVHWPAAFRTVMKQWRIAFEIGAANRDAGVETVPFRKLFQKVVDFDQPHI